MAFFKLPAAISVMESKTALVKAAICFALSMKNLMVLPMVTIAWIMAPHRVEHGDQFLHAFDNNCVPGPFNRRIKETRFQVAQKFHCHFIEGDRPFRDEVDDYGYRLFYLGIDFLRRWAQQLNDPGFNRLPGNARIWAIRLKIGEIKRSRKKKSRRY